MTISNLSDYVDRESEQVWRPPARATDVELYGFVIPASGAAIDAMLTHDLNLPSGNIVDYRCANPNMIVTFGRSAKRPPLTRSTRSVATSARARCRSGAWPPT